MTNDNDKKPEDDSEFIESEDAAGSASDEPKDSSDTEDSRDAGEAPEDPDASDADAPNDDGEQSPQSSTDERDNEPKYEDLGEEELLKQMSMLGSPKLEGVPSGVPKPGSVIYLPGQTPDEPASESEGEREAGDKPSKDAETDQAEPEPAASDRDRESLGSVLGLRVPDREDDEDDGQSEIDALREQLSAALKTVYETKKDFPDIPVILLFGLSQSGKTTLAYRLECNARFAGRPVDPPVWKEKNKGAAGTAEMQAHFFGTTANLESADKEDGHRYLLVDFPGEKWATAIGNRDQSLNTNMLKMMSLCTGYIFALEAQQVFPGFESEPTTETHEDENANKAEDYENLYQNIAKITDIDSRISALVQETPPYQDIEEAFSYITSNDALDRSGNTHRDPFETLVKEKLESNLRKGTNIRSPKPVFVAFTKADALAKSVIEAYLAYCETHNKTVSPGLLELCSDYEDSSSYEAKSFLVPGPSAILHRYSGEIVANVQNDDTRTARAIYEMMDGFQYPSHGALKSARELFANLCTNTSQLRVDFVSPFDGMKEKLVTLDEKDEHGNDIEIQLKPKMELEEFGLSRNMDWLKASSIDVSKRRSWLKRLRQWFNHTNSTPLLTLWISNSQLKEARYLAEEGDDRFKNTLSKKLKRVLIQEKDCELPANPFLARWRYGLLAFIPLLFSWLGVSLAQSSSSGLANEPITGFNITQKDIVTPDLLSGFERDLKADWLALDGVIIPWSGIPRTGVSQINDRYANGRRCDSSAFVCRSGEDGAVSYLENVTEIGSRIGFDANYNYNPDEDGDQALAELSVPTRTNTEESSGNSKLFVPFHRMITSLWLPDPNRTPTELENQFNDQLINVINVRGYPFGTGSTSADLLSELGRSLATTPGANQTDMARALNLHIAMLHIKGLVAARDGSFANAETYYREAVYLARYQTILGAALSTDQSEWLQALKAQASLLTTVDLKRLENNLIVSGFLKRGGSFEGGNSAYVEAVLSTISALEKTAHEASKSPTNVNGTRVIAPAVLPAVNARLLRALLVLEGEEEELLSLGAPPAVPINEQTSPGSFGETIAYRNAVASILLEEQVDEFGRRMLEKNADDNIDSLKLLAGLRVQSSINSGAPLKSDTLWSDDFIAKGDQSVVTEDRQIRQRELDDFRERLQDQIGKRLMEQAREANRANEQDQKETLFNRLGDADWLNFLQKATVATYRAFGISLMMLVLLGVGAILSGFLIYTYFDNLRSAFKDAFTSRHATGAKNTDLIQAASGQSGSAS